MVQVLSTPLMAAKEQWKNTAFYFKLKKTVKSSDDDLTCTVFSLKNAVAHLETSDPSGTLTIQNYL